MLAEVPAFRITGKQSAAEIWEKKALRAQLAIAKEAGVPSCRVAIVALNSEGSLANAIFSPGPPEIQLKPWEGCLPSFDEPKKEGPSEDLFGDSESLVSALLCYLWKELSEGARFVFRFVSTGNFSVEAFWWNSAVNVSVSLFTDEDEPQQWSATVTSEEQANVYGLTPELARLTARSLAGGLIGMMDGRAMRMTVEHP